METQLMWLPLSPKNTVLEQSAWNSFSDQSVKKNSKECYGCKVEIAHCFNQLLLFFNYSCVQCCCNLLGVQCRSLNAKLSNLAISMVNVSSVPVSMSLFLFFSYLQFFFLIPSPTALATYIIPLFIWTAWLLSLSILHMLSLTKTSQNILNWFCFCSNFFF